MAVAWQEYSFQFCQLWVVKCLLLILNYSNSKCKVTCGLWAPVHQDSYQRETVYHLKLLTFHSACCLFIIAFFSEKKYSRSMAMLSTLESTTFDGTVSPVSKWLSLCICYGQDRHLPTHSQTSLYCWSGQIQACQSSTTLPKFIFFFCSFSAHVNKIGWHVATLLWLCVVGLRAWRLWYINMLFVKVSLQMLWKDWASKNK